MQGITQTVWFDTTRLKGFTGRGWKLYRDFTLRLEKLATPRYLRVLSFLSANILSQEAAVYTQVLETRVCGCLTPSNSPLVRQNSELTVEMYVHRSPQEGMR
ncbi:hypothetical protein Lepto7375DRAFT_7683 [Leptolyngbya sp. PCC 7375]|nr:hypothetical protein Lepto7375DRAFT_7683 [Leptolyngbya sp. PCC 7375]